MPSRSRASTRPAERTVSMSATTASSGCSRRRVWSQSIEHADAPPRSQTRIAVCAASTSDLSSPGPSVSGASVSVGSVPTRSTSSRVRSDHSSDTALQPLTGRPRGGDVWLDEDDVSTAQIADAELVRLVIDQRESNGEGDLGAFRIAVGDGDPAAHQRRQLSADRQSESSAASTGDRRRHLPEAFERGRAMFGRDSRTGVAHGKTELRPP